jgi:hypothetical protein
MTTQNAAYFDGTTNNYIVCNPFKNFPATEITAEIWINTDDKQKKGTPISYAVPGEDNEFILFDYKNMAPNIKREEKYSGIAFNDGHWHHCAVTWRSDTGELILFKDGQKVWSHSYAKGKSLNNGGSLIFAQEQDSVGGSFDVNQAFKGWMREVRIWNKVRSEAEIKADMSRSLTGNESGLVGYWPLTEFTGDIAKDKTSNGNDGKVHGVVVKEPPETPPIQPAFVQIKSAANDAVLDVAGGQTNPGTTVLVYANNGGDGQQWQMTADGVIKSKLGDYALDMKDIPNYPWAKELVINPINGSETQKWEVGADGTIKNKSNDFAIALYDTGSYQVGLVWYLGNPPQAYEKWEIVNL